MPLKLSTPSFPLHQLRPIYMYPQDTLYPTATNTPNTYIYIPFAPMISVCVFWFFLVQQLKSYNFLFFGF